MIEFREVGFTYPGASAAALAGVSFRLEPGGYLVVLGANGSGKSTLARLCDGLVLPTAGEVVVDGMDTRDPLTLWEVRSRVALVFQNPDNQIVGTTVEEDVAFGPENLGLDRGEIRRRVDVSLGAVGLVGMERREPHLLSGGQKQRLAIAGALAMQPLHIVFDEPTAMLDPEGRAAVLRAIGSLRGSDRGVVHVSHRLEEAAAADEVLCLSQGRVVFHGPPAELLPDTDLLEACGLEVPAAGRLAGRLRSRGIEVPATALTAEEVMSAL